MTQKEKYIEVTTKYIDYLKNLGCPDQLIDNIIFQHKISLNIFWGEKKVITAEIGKNQKL